MQFDERAIPKIADLLRTRAQRAPFAVQDEAVYEINLRCEELDRNLRLLLWPSLRRVDVYLGESSWVLKEVAEVELLEEVEVIFKRPHPEGHLFVTTRGWVAMVS